MAYLNHLNNVRNVNRENVNRLYANNLRQENLMMLGLGYLVLRDRRRRRIEREEAEARQRRARRWYVKPWVLGREVHSQFRNIFEEMDAACQGDYMAYVRMDRESFHEVLQRITPRIRKSTR